MTQNSQDYVSVIGFSLIQPVIELVEKLESSAVVEPNEVHTGQGENGYSCAVVALTILLLESALNRTRYLRKDANSERISVAHYFSKISPDQNLALDVDEIFAARDAIVHNHLWEAKINTIAMKSTSPPKLVPGYGNTRLRRVIDPETRLSRRLKINLFPPRIWRRDAYVVFKTVGRTLATLEEMDRAYFYISARHFRFRGHLVRLREVLNALPYRRRLAHNTFTKYALAETGEALILSVTGCLSVACGNWKSAKQLDMPNFTADHMML